jgi:hypothetical protein
MYHAVASARSVILPTLLAAVAALDCKPQARQAPTGGDAGTNGGGTLSASGGAGAGGASAGGAGTGGASTKGTNDAGTAGAGGTGGINTTGGSSGTPDAGPGNPLVPGKTMACDSPPLAVPTQHIEAECAFGPSTGNCAGTSGSQQGTQLQDNSTTVGYIEGGDVLSYSGVTMDGADTLTLRYSKGTDGGSVEIRLDSATGTLLGTFTPTSTNGWTTWSTATVKLTAATGTHALYLVATGSTGGIYNLDWIELSAAANAGASAPAIHINHLGFDALGAKQAVVEGAAGLTRFHVVGSDGVASWCGDLTGVTFSDWGSSKTYYVVDFTELTRSGKYRLQVGSFTSGYFEIADRFLFATTFPGVLGYFNASRADDADVWAADASVPFVGSSNKADVRGGWYDASGDISKYLTHLSYANFMNPQQIPLVAWALAWVYDRDGAVLSGTAAAVQAEALWGADYLLRVLDPAGYFYTNVFDHWSGDVNQRQICAIVGESGAATADYQSALREGGGMSIAALARIARWKADGSFTSAQYLAGAQKAFDYLNTNGIQYDDDGKENVIDDYAGLMAASELFATTQSATYLQAARARATSLVSRLSSDGYFIADGASRPFWHASDAGLPVVALARYVQVETDAKSSAAAIQAIQKHLNYLLQVTGAVANPFGLARQHTTASAATFFIPHVNETDYWWQGENARLASLAAAALLGAQAIGTSGSQYLDLLRFAGNQLDWVLGKNPYDISFMHGFGRNNPPDYCASKAQVGTLTGGISNGITGSNSDGTGIQWRVGANGGCGDDWRWVEQWLPHSAWFAVAIGALAE